MFRSVELIPIEIYGLPRTATTTDIRQLLTTYSVIDKVKTSMNTPRSRRPFHCSLSSVVSLDYRMFHPTGKAYVVLDSLEHQAPVLEALKSATLLGHQLSASLGQDRIRLPERARGQAGRAQALQRDVVAPGNGPQGGIVEVGRSVYLEGLPYKMTPDDVRRQFLNGYQLISGGGDVSKTEGCVCSIYCHMPRSNNCVSLQAALRVHFALPRQAANALRSVSASSQCTLEQLPP
jgi:hypothetical protein